MLCPASRLLLRSALPAQRPLGVVSAVRCMTFAATLPKMSAGNLTTFHSRTRGNFTSLSSQERHYQRLCFVASEADQAQQALSVLTKKYGQHDILDADVIIALGGDGFMLETMHRYMDLGIPLFGMNRGTVGFLMNQYIERDLLERVEASHISILHPLHMEARTVDGQVHTALAINEVFAFRMTRQAAQLRITVDDRVRMRELVCDGALVATPAGSTAYNLSAHGPVLPLDADILALTPISAFRPRRWKGALLKRTSVVTIDSIDPVKRPISAVADHFEVRNVASVIIKEATSHTIRLMCDPEETLEDRILAEQFNH